MQSIARKASDGADVSLSQAYRLKSDMRENVAQDRAEAVFSQVALFREMVDKNRYSAVVEEFKLKGMQRALGLIACALIFSFPRFALIIRHGGRVIPSSLLQ